MKRGDIYLAAEKGEYSGKPRPVVIMQHSLTIGFRDRVTVCPLTGEDIGAPMFRYPVSPDTENGLNKISFVMVDKINTISKQRLTKKIGTLSVGAMDAIGTLTGFWLGL